MAMRWRKAPPPSCCADLVPLLDVALQNVQRTEYLKSKKIQMRQTSQGLSHPTTLLSSWQFCYFTVAFPLLFPQGLNLKTPTILAHVAAQAKLSWYASHLLL